MPPCFYIFPSAENCHSAWLLRLELRLLRELSSEDSSANFCAACGVLAETLADTCAVCRPTSCRRHVHYHHDLFVHYACVLFFFYTTRLRGANPQPVGYEFRSQYNSGNSFKKHHCQSICCDLRVKKVSLRKTCGTLAEVYATSLERPFYINLQLRGFRSTLKYGREAFLRIPPLLKS